MGDAEEEGTAELVVQFVPSPLFGVAVGVDVGREHAVDRLVDHLLDVIVNRIPLEHVATAIVDDLTLLVHHVVVLEQVFADLEVAGLHLFLRSLDGAGDQRMFDHFPLFGTQPVHNGGDAFGAEQTHQIVFQREEEPRGAGVALAPGAAAQLAVDAPGFVALGADDLQAAGVVEQVIPHDLTRRQPGVKGEL